MIIIIIINNVNYVYGVEKYLHIINRVNYINTPLNIFQTTSVEIRKKILCAI